MAFLDNFTPNQPLRQVANVTQQNRIANILNDLQGVGCKVEKDFGREGRGWKIVVENDSDNYNDTRVDPQLEVRFDTATNYLQTRKRQRYLTVNSSSQVELAHDTFDSWTNVIKVTNATVDTSVTAGPQNDIRWDTTNVQIQTRQRDRRIAQDTNSIYPANDSYSAWSGVFGDTRLRAMLKQIQGHSNTGDYVIVSTSGTIKWVALDSFACP